ncbi:AAA family ATPase [Methylorubrum rhodesianum]|uniref:AAA family ATPase n=2 Tax=Methylorubrum rhodesianum TaxID=29427 RepID=A0ABU9ZCS6_9HYPH
MRLDYLELCGFRGFRERQRVDFGPGFTVICGRNGVGKSTLCDAVEFALTGQIDKYLVDKAAKESLDDYVWWRGEGQPEAHFVTVGFRAADGSGFAVTRSRETGADRDAARIEAMLCVPGAKPERALQQVCRTSIIRDEWIAALSLDLTETQRFELVRAALGAIEGPDYASKAREVVSSAEAVHDAAAHDYEAARTRLTAALTDLEETRDVALQAGDVAAALSIVTELTPDGGSDLGGRVAAARQALARLRLSLGEMASVADEVRAVTALRDTVVAPDFRAGRDAAAVAAAEAEAAVQEARHALEAAEARLHREQETDALAASLAILVDHGSRIGLHDDRCPLCRTPQGASAFETGLAAARERLAARRSGVPEARAEVAAARTRIADAGATLREAEAAVLRFASAEAGLAAREEALSAELVRRSLDGNLAHDAGALDDAVQAERSRLIDLERSILTLEASRAVERVTDLEARLQALRAEADAAGDRLARARAAVMTARTLDRTVRRTNAEIIDERLAVISPLLNVRIPTEAGHPFRREAGQRSDLMSATR